MHLRLCVPDISAHPTGGNHYNTAIRAAWPAPDEVDPHTGWPPSPSNADAWLVDSLLVRTPEMPRVLMDAPPAVLLLHYLHLVDPTQAHIEAIMQEAQYVQRFAGCVVPSRFVARQLTEHGVPTDRIRVAVPGLSAAYRHGPRPASTLEPPFQLLTVANLLPNKQLVACLRMLETLDEVPWTWRIIGDDTLDSVYATEVQTAVQDSPVRDRITLSGAQPAEAVRTAYDNADVVLCPSRFETSSMVAREALACGVPVLGFRVGGLPETLGPTASDGLVAPKDFDALATRLQELLTTPTRYRAWHHEAIRASRGIPSWSETARRVRHAVRAFAELPSS